MDCQILLFDLDGTLLRSDKSISPYTLKVLQACRERGILIGISTSRSEKNSQHYISPIKPEIMILSGGALVKYNGRYIYSAEFTENETNEMINTARTVCGSDCEITIDTKERHFWNYKTDPNKADAGWGESIYTDFSEFSEKSLKMCVEIFDADSAARLADALTDCDCVRFSDGYWYKFTKKSATKENAIITLCEKIGFSPDNIIAFGDDFADIGMLKLCGRGIAMGNAIDEVKACADIVIGGNDDDGIAEYLLNELKNIKYGECSEKENGKD